MSTCPRGRMRWVADEGAACREQGIALVASFRNQFLVRQGRPEVVSQSCSGRVVDWLFTWSRGPCWPSRRIGAAASARNSAGETARRKVRSATAHPDLPPHAATPPPRLGPTCGQRCLPSASQMAGRGLHEEEDYADFLTRKYGLGEVRTEEACKHRCIARIMQPPAHGAHFCCGCRVGSWIQRTELLKQHRSEDSA